MDYRDFTDRKTAYDEFIKYRKKVLDSVDKNFTEVFTDLCSNALAGDCVAQDCVAYFFNRGVPQPNSENKYLLSPNYEYYMSWQILAGANGNEFALEKLEFFLNSALGAIINDEDILTTALKKKNITKNNALMVISNLICEGIVDELEIQPKDLIQINNKVVPYSAQLNRNFLDAMEDCLPNVVDYLIS